jgi:hypothetical protein
MQQSVVQADTKLPVSAVKTNLKQTITTRRRDFTASRLMTARPHQSKS